MAGKVATYQTSQLRNAEFVNPNRTFGRTMEEDDVLSHLSDQSFDKRADILEQLKSMVRRNGGRLPFSNQKNIFKGLALALNDSNWDVRNKCTQLVHELIPFMEDDLDECMHILLPHLIPNLGDSKIALRRTVIQTIHVYMKYTSDVQQILRAIVKHGLESSDAKTRKEVIIALPMLFTPEFSQENFYEIAQSLAKRLLECSKEEDGEGLQQNALLSLNKIKNLVGIRAFKEYLGRLSPGLRTFYMKLNHEEDSDNMYSQSSWGDASTHYSSNGVENSSRKQSQQMSPPGASFSGGDQRKEFGFVPNSIMDRLNDQVNYRARAQAIEDLKNVVKELEDVYTLEPHLPEFIDYLKTLLADPNFKIKTATLDILSLLIDKVNTKIKPHLRVTVLALTDLMSDNKIVVRQLIMRIIVSQLMHILSPHPVLAVICENLSHKNSRVRQETLNIVIASLLEFPSYEFDLGYLCKTIAHTLVDQKRQVRQAALESFAVLAQAMGAGKLGPLVTAVDSVELAVDGNGLMAAVQARLARRQLPKLNADKLVDYATPIPNSAGSRGSKGALSLPPGADVEWILAASHSSSARMERPDREVVSVGTISSRSSPDTFSQDLNAPRRTINSGKARMPWEASNTNGANSNRTNSGGMSPSTTTWQYSTQDSPLTKPPKIKGQLLNTVPPYEQADSGSYKNMFLERKRQSSENIAQPFSVYPSSEVGDVTSGRDGGFSYGPTPRAPDSNMRFSKSWSDPRMFEEVHKQRLLLPIPGDPHIADWTIEDDKKKDASPIPTKPALARSNSTSRGSGSKQRKIPPINTATTTSMVVDRSDPEVAYISGLDSARGDSAVDEGHNSGDEGLTTKRSEMARSLQRIRDSAKTKQSRLQSRSPSPPASGDPLEDSGFFTNMNSTRAPSDADSEFSAATTPHITPKPKKGRNPDAPFSMKPKLIARKNTQEQQLLIQQQQQQQLQNQPQPRFDPLGGKTFKTNPRSDVEVVGNSPFSSNTSSTTSVPVQSKPNGGGQLYNTSSSIKPKKKQQPTKGGVALSPIGVVGTSPSSSLADYDDSRQPYLQQYQHQMQPAASPAPISLAGRSVFDVGITGSSSIPNVTSDNTPSGGFPGNRRQSRQENQMPGSKPPPGIYGTPLRHGSSDKPPQSSDDSEATSEGDDDDDEDVSQMAMTSSARKHISQKARQLEEEAEKKAAEKADAAKRVQMRQQNRQAKIAEAAEKRRLAAQAKNGVTDQDLDTIDGLTISGSGGNSNPPNVTKRPPPNRKPSPGKGAIKARVLTEGQSKCENGLVGGEPMPYDDLEPYTDPNAALYAALQTIAKDEWTEKCDGLCGLRRIAKHHPETLNKELPAVVQAVTAEVKNLRSSVCRMAAICIGEMCISQKKRMDPNADKITKLLLNKTGENAAKFLITDADDALYKMTENISPHRMAIALMHGVGHKNILVRKYASSTMATLVEKLGPSEVLTGKKDLTDKILMSAAQFVKDSGPDTRYNGQKIFHLLMEDPRFEQQYCKHVPETTRNDIKDKLEALKRKGLPDNPADHHSARQRRIDRSNSTTRGNSANSDAPKPQPRSNISRADVEEEIKSICTQMAANDFRERSKAISRFTELLTRNQPAVCNQLTKIFDKFIPCLRDSNFKVALVALTTLTEMMPKIASSLGGCTALTVETVSSNLASKNTDIYNAASAVLDAILDNVDPAQLLQPFVAVAQAGNAKARPDVIERVAYLVSQVYPDKPKLVKVHALPLLWTLLGQSAASASAGGQGSNNTFKTSTTNFAHTLSMQMGEQELLHHANTTTSVTPRMIQTLRDMLATST